ncbi:MAG: flagellar hook-basal body complex protein FliE [Alphaproteobacteria bacterium]|nr:flagellar hook-basal body complex protein FliE [Alphaproteobacteria bacterium]
MGTAKIASAPEGIKFSDFIHEGVKDAIETMKAGETMSAKAITGEAGLTDVVQAITSAELAVDTITALRDRMISAYQEIMRMPI